MHTFSIIKFEYDFKIVDNAVKTMYTASSSMVGMDFVFNEAIFPLVNTMFEFPFYIA